MNVSIYLDDSRSAPEGWLRTHTSQECMFLLNKHQGKVAQLSLDHDLSNDQLYGTGYDVLVLLEEHSFFNNWDLIPDIIQIHTQNNVARDKMLHSLHAIAKNHRKHFGSSVMVKDGCLTLHS